MALARWGTGLAVGFLIVAGCGRTPPPATTSNPPAPPPPEPVQATAAPEPEVVAAAEPPPPAPPRLVIEPAEAILGPNDPGLQFVVGRLDPAVGRADRTKQAAWTIEPAGILEIGADGYARPVGAGTATVRGRLDEGVVEAQVVVRRPEGRPWDFANDISPRLTRFGCNTGGCHAKSEGQNGFHLSLFGYDPEGDYQSIVREASGRRIAPFAPEQSLFLRKATGRMPHGGGQRIRPGSADEVVLREWLAAGAPERVGESHGALQALKVEPADLKLGEPGPQQIRVVAEYADGHRRDVTRLASFRSNDDSVAEIDPTGLVSLLRRAETDLVVRYQSQVVAARISTIINPDLKYDFAAVSRNNFIDEQLLRRLEALNVPPSPLASDTAFLRRVKLDLTGEQPEPTEIRQFLDDADPDKRAKKVDELLKSKDFWFFWQLKFGDMLQISPQRFPNGAGQYQRWLSQKLNENTPWDVMVRELLTALGNPNEFGHGEVNYALDGPDAPTASEQTAQRFLGLRLRCAHCHDHPFDTWTQDDYFGLAAFFAKTTGGMNNPQAMNGRVEIKVNPEGQVEHLRTKKPAVPKLPKGDVVELPADEDPRKALADWMTGPDNPYFARAMANWVWAQFFGKGIADPPDDLSAANPPVHPELLDALARHFVESKYDLRALIRAITTSRAYGLSAATVAGNEQDTRLFSHHVPRPLTAHQMADALAQATGVKDRYRLGNSGQNAPLVERRAIEISDPSTPSPVLDAFGRCGRVNGCSSVATPSLSLRQALLVIGGTVVENKVSHPTGYLSRMLEYDAEPVDIVENLYLRTVCRKPTPEESSTWVGLLAGKTGPALHEVAEDLFWALLNSREFAFNH